MHQLITYTEKGGKIMYEKFEALSKNLTLQQASRHYGDIEWQIYSQRQVVRNCANSSEVAEIYKTRVL